MLGALFRSFRGGALGGKTIEVLSRNYSLEVSHPTFIAMIQRLTTNFAETLNEHEMAVQFLAEFTKYHVQADHPHAVREVSKFVRISKAAYDSGLAVQRHPQLALFSAALERFGIDPATID